MRRVSSILPLVLALAGTPALAQTESAPAAASANPIALAEARKVVVRLVPPGTYKRLMGSTMSNMMSSMTDSMKALPMRELAELGGMSAEDAQKIAKVDLEQVTAIYDPHWRERQQRTMTAMFAAMGDFFTTIEPDLRDAMAHAYVNRFSADELQDLDRYLSTPTGTKFAGMQMTIMTDPAMTTMMKGMMPRMMQQMPHFLEAAKAATKDLPQPRRVEDLTPAERARIAKMLGVGEDKLSNPKAVL